VTSITSLPLGGAGTEPAEQVAVDDPTAPDIDDDGDGDGMMQIELDGELIWIPSQNDEQRETA
jgi:hypothetical protein